MKLCLFIILLLVSNLTACAKKAPGTAAGLAPDREVTFTSNLIPYEPKDFNAIPRKTLRKLGYHKWPGKIIVFRKPSKQYKAFRFYNVAKAVFKNDLAIDLFENRELAGKQAVIQNFYRLKANSENIYIDIDITELRRPAYVVLEPKAEQIDNAYFLENHERIKKLLHKNIWKDPDYDLIPLEKSVRPMEGLAKIKVLSYSTVISDESSETCSILLTCQNAKKRKFTTCYIPGTFFTQAPKLRYPNIPDQDWKLIFDQRIAKQMDKLALKLSWGNPRKAEKITLDGEKAEKWIYPQAAIIISNNKIVRWEKPGSSSNSSSD